jgi:6-phosphogluconolactonase
MRSRIASLFFFLVMIAALAGCGTSSQNVVMPQIASARFAFVANNTAGSISVFQVGPTTGQLSDAGALAPAGCSGPTYGELHPTMPLLFVTCQNSNNMVILSVDKNSGALAMVGTVVTGANPHFIALDPKGKFLYVANTSSNTLSAFAVDGSGVLTEISGSPFATGTTPYTVKVDDAGVFVYATNRDSNNVSAYHIDAITGALTEIAGSPFAAGSGARYIELSGKFAFVPNRFANSVSVYTVDPSSGALTQVAGSPFPSGSDPRSAAVDHTGHFLYVGNTVSNDISAYTIDAATGALTAMAGSPFATGSLPLHMEMDEMGKIVYVSDNASNDVRAFQIDGVSGMLTPIQTMVTPGGPFSVSLM